MSSTILRSSLRGFFSVWLISLGVGLVPTAARAQTVHVSQYLPLVPNVQLPNKSTVGVVSGDFLGDGSTLAISIHSTGSDYLNYYDEPTTGRYLLHTGVPELKRGADSGDLDGDGDDDYVVSVLGAKLGYVFWNDGTGEFRPQPITSSLGSTSTEDVEIAELNGDGFPDILWVNGFGAPLSISLSTAWGIWSEAPVSYLPPPHDRGQAADSADLDRDGDIDFAIAGPGYGIRVYINYGDHFREAPASDVPSTPRLWTDLRFMDFDGDLYLDLIGSTLGGPNVLWKNNGGSFTPHIPWITFWDSSFPQDSTAVEVGDVNRDGRSDFVFGNRDQRDSLVLNLPSGFQYQDLTSAIDPTQALGMGDYDRDGDLDLYKGLSGRDCFLTNVFTQLHTPDRLRIGQPFTIDLFATPGSGAQDNLAVLGLSFNLADNPLEIPGAGTLWLDLQGLQVSLPFPVSGQTGSASLLVTAPNTPGLVGKDVFLQGAVVKDQNAILTNLVRDTFRF